MNDLVLVFLLVSCVSWVFQVLAFARLAARRAKTATEELVSGGYLRTVGCRVLAATVYVVVAAIQLAGDGTLGTESLVVWIAVQILWWLNSLADIRIRRALSQTERPPDALRRNAAAREGRSSDRRPGQGPRQAFRHRRRAEDHPRPPACPAVPEGGFLTGWANLGKEGESMPAQTPQDAAAPPTASETVDAEDAPSPMETAQGLLDVLASVRDELKALRTELKATREDSEKRDADLGKSLRRHRLVVTGLVVSFVFDVAVTAFVTLFASQLHSSQLNACQLNNQSLAKQIVLWDHIASLSITAKTPPAARKSDEQLLAFIRETFSPHPCAALYHLP